LIVAWVAWGLLALLGGCGGGGGGVPPDVVLLTVDTLRADRWGCLGDPDARTPEIDRLARQGLLYPEGRAPSPITLPSHASLMTGLPPAIHGIRDNGIFRLEEGSGRTLAEAFRSAGWTTAAFVSSFPLAERFGLVRGFDRYDDRLAGSDAPSGHLPERTADRTLARLESWLDGGDADDAPLFLWVHYFDPHAEYAAPDPWPRVCADPYRAEVAFTDAQTGRLLRVLDDRRGGRARVMAVAADHGEGLGEHGELTHGVLLQLSTIRIPIVVVAGGPAGLDRTPVPLEGLAATLLRSAGLDDRLGPQCAPPLDDPPGALHAETLYPHFNFGWAGLRAREEGGWRLVAGPVDRLYRIDTDPAEMRDVADDHPERVAELRAALEDEWDRRREHAFTAPELDLDPDDLEALHALGYLSSGAREGDAEAAFDHGPDPAGRIHVLTLLNVGVTDSGRDPRRAIVSLRQVLADDPENRLALEYLGRAHEALGEIGEARDAWERALALGPNPTSVYLGLAQIYRSLGERGSLRRTLEAAIVVDPLSVPAHQALCEMALVDGRFDDALMHAQRAVEIRPRVSRSTFLLARAYEGKGNREEARAAWQRVLELEPTGPLAQRARAALTSPEGREP
jgi:arylsulfatase A-like enzyme